MNGRQFSGMLLHGVTGSGKTAIYLSAMRAVLEAGRSAILLVPEIGLTPAVAADLHQLFGDGVAILHSALSDKERAEQWHRIKRGDARMVVGTRSAVFAPLSDLALVIVDEEQDPSYKQEEMPRYHARDVAVMRAKMANAAVVLGSATPSLESYFNARRASTSCWNCQSAWSSALCRKSRSSTCGRNFRKRAASRSYRASWPKKLKNALSVKSRSWCC